MSGTISIIIPAFNQEKYVVEAIQSVLEQTYSDWELIVVDDGSTDSTANVVQQFSDRRIRYIHQTNRGLPGARNTGIANSTGEFIAFLDADDRYHPRKLEVQLNHLTQNPHVGLSYTSRISIDAGGNRLTYTRAPTTASLANILLGFPFTINDILIHRHWVDSVNGYDESFLLNSEDRDFYVRLALAGCQFAGIEDTLAFRRFHAGRLFKNIPEKIETFFRSLDTAFANPSCPEDVLTLRDAAAAEVYKPWVLQAYWQDEVELAATYLDRLRTLQPEMFEHGATKFYSYLISFSVREGGDHEAILRKIFARLPPELSADRSQLEKMVGYGYMQRGFRDLLWRRWQEGEENFLKASTFGVQPDRILLDRLLEQLWCYEAEFGEKTQELLRDMVPYLRQFSRGTFKRLYSHYYLNSAFKSFRQQDYVKVLNNIGRAISYEPNYLANRGAISLAVRSVLGLTTVGHANIHKVL